jgi:hypothetical protein
MQCGAAYGSSCGLARRYACAVTRERRTNREKERGARILHGTSSVCFMCVDVCFICIIWMLHVFHPDGVCVSSGCCNGYTHMLQAYVSNVSSVLDVVCCKCFIWMLHMIF